MTIRALLQRYLETVSVKKRSILTEKSTIRSLCNDPISNCYLSEFKPAVIAEYRDRRLKEVKPSTVNRQMSILKHCISIARSEWGIEINSNPFDIIKLPPLSEGRERRLKDGEWELIKLHAPKARNRLLLPIIEFAIETGMRQGEILGLRWENINFVSRLAFLPLTKNGSSRKVPLSLRAVAILAGLRRDQELVFPVCRKTLYSAWSSLMGRTGIEGLRFHDLRHEAISRFFERGLSLPEVAVLKMKKQFVPHAIILTELAVPRPIFAAALIQADKFKRIDFEPHSHPLTYVKQVLNVMPDGVPCFGRTTGFIINYTANKSVKFNRIGSPISIMNFSYIIGELKIIF